MGDIIGSFGGVAMPFLTGGERRAINFANHKDRFYQLQK
jgi:hypothetical protein